MRSIEISARTIEEAVGEGLLKLNGRKGLPELEQALLQFVDDTAGASYCFKIEGAIKANRISTVSNPRHEYDIRGGSGSGTVIAFWNHASDNDILNHGFTFYYLDAERKLGGVLKGAEFGEVTIRADRLEPMDSVLARGEEIRIGGI